MVNYVRWHDGYYRWVLLARHFPTSSFPSRFLTKIEQCFLAQRENEKADEVHSDKQKVKQCRENHLGLDALPIIHLIIHQRIQLAATTFIK